MDIVLTQPEAQAKQLVVKLKAVLSESTGSMRFDCFPLLHINRLTVRDEHKLASLTHADMICCTSPSVVPCLPAIIPDTVRSVRWYSVGEATAQALYQRFGIQAIYPRDQQNSEALLRMESLVQGANKKMLLVTGMGGRRLLEEVLVSRGFVVERLVLYSRVPIIVSNIDIVIRAASIWLVTSMAALEQLSIQDRNNRLHLLVTSQRLAQQAVDYGYNCHTATSNKPEHIIRALLDMDKSTAG